MLEPRRRRNREHKNSRNGCQQCKARKVKCDEGKPKCNSCTRRATPCTYTIDQPGNLLSSSNSPSTASETIPGTLTLVPKDPSAWRTVNVPKTEALEDHENQSSRSLVRGRASKNPGSSSLSGSSSAGLNMEHLELFHHFTTVTGPSVNIDEPLRELWTATVPRIALAHKFLMHSLLAVSALHMAHINPNRRETCWEQAILHQDQALKLVQSEVSLPDALNADALLAFSIPTVWYGFASHVFPRVEEIQRPLQGTIQSINLLRHVRDVGPSVKQWIRQGPLAPLSKLNPENYKAAADFFNPETSTHFSKLLVFCSTMSGDTELEDVENFAAAASSLRATFLKVEATPEGDPNTPPVWHWAMRLQASFVERLAELHVIPLVLVAHWCVLLAATCHFWWMHGWVEKTMTEVQTCIPEKHRHWLQWPLKKIRASY